MQQTQSIAFKHPSQLLRAFLNSPPIPQLQKCKCQCHNEISSQHNCQQLQDTIEQLQENLDAMNQEIVEVEGMLTQRDSLYHQLDHLRNQRENIEYDIVNSETIARKPKKIVNNGGLKEINQRLRRRIREVTQYIEKMEDQNNKIQEEMYTTQQAFTLYSPQNTHLNYTEYCGPNSPTWMSRMSAQRHTPPTHDQGYSKFNRDYFDGIRKRLQNKQEQAWDKVKRQQEEIQNRNARSLMNFHRGAPKRSGFLSPKYNRAY